MAVPASTLNKHPLLMKTSKTRHVTIGCVIALSYAIAMPKLAAEGSLDPLTGFTPKVNFTESYRESVVSYRDCFDGDCESFYEMRSSGSTSLSLVASMDGVDVSSINDATEIGFEIGEFTFADRLGSAYSYSPTARKAVFVFTEIDDFDREFRTGTVTCVWNAKTLSITASFKLGVASIAAEGLAGSEGTIQEEITASVTFGGMTGSRRVYVGGRGSVGYSSALEADLNSVSIAGSADYRVPVCTITAPRNALRIPNTLAPEIVVTGTATDGYSIDRVEARVNNGSWTAAVLTPKQTGLDDLGDPILSDKLATWETTLPMVPGPNVIEARGIDPDGNPSKVTTRTVNYVVPAQLNVAVSGEGSVSKGFLGASAREEGVSYKITATPARGSVFDGWLANGVRVSNTPNFTFVMAQGLVLTAQFVANPFPGAFSAGSYSGLVEDGTAPSHTNRGLLTLSVSSTGAASGAIILAGERSAIRGVITGSGLATFEAKRRNKTILRAELNLNLKDKTFSGDVSLGGATVAVATGGKHAFDRVARYAGPARATLLVPSAGDVGAPVGAGYATVTFGTTGPVVLVGAAADGTRWTCRTALLADASLPVYVPLHAGAGSLSGWLTYRDLPDTSDLDGNLFWVRPALPRASTYQAGFSTMCTAIGSLFSSPGKGSRMIAELDSNGGEVMVELTGGGLSAQLDILGFIGITHSISVPTPNAQNLKISFNKSTGSFTGSFKSPMDGKTKKIAGAAFQKTGFASGYFLNTPECGSVMLLPHPVP